MTREQKELVRASFDAVGESAAAVALLFYGKLFEMDPAARKLFHNDLRLQGQKLMDMLAAIIASLDDFERIRPKLIELSRRHVTYGVRPEQYDTLAVALEWALVHASEGGYDRQTRAAWRALIGMVADTMKSVYTSSAVL
jgi:hemoglobin-like flavoprotein